MTTPLAVDTPWLTVEQAATYSHRHPQTVSIALRKGELRGNQPGRKGRWLIHRDDLDAWIRGEIATVQPERVTRGRRSA